MKKVEPQDLKIPATVSKVSLFSLLEIPGSGTWSADICSSASSVGGSLKRVSPKNMIIITVLYVNRGIDTNLERGEGLVEG